jgi:hypothetical protein
VAISLPVKNTMTCLAKIDRDERFCAAPQQVRA